MDAATGATIVAGYAAGAAVLIGVLRGIIHGAFSRFELQLEKKFVLQKDFDRVERVLTRHLRRAGEE